VPTTELKTVQDLDVRSAALCDGEYGSRTDILTRALLWYESVGVPGGLVLRGQVHPYAEYLAEASHLELDTGPGHVDRALPVDLGTDEITTWTTWDHPADGALATLVESRLDAGVHSLRWDDDARVRLEAARRLVTTTVPAFGADTLRYVRRVVLIDDPTVAGTTWTDVIGLLAISHHTLSNVFDAAETLLHEALHSKGATIERGLYVPYLSEEGKELVVTIPWRLGENGSGRWTSSRAYDAFYVYAHLSVFTARLACGELDPRRLARCRRVCFRSEYLLRRLGDVCAGELDPQRLALAEWLGALRVPAFDLSPRGQEIVDTMPPP
jgi:hypothetical protein